MSENRYSCYSGNLLLLKYKTVPPFFLIDSGLWVKIFRERYVAKHKALFYRPFLTDCLMSLEPKSKMKKNETRFYRLKDTEKITSK